jgi:hypothetical protein
MTFVDGLIEKCYELCERSTPHPIIKVVRTLGYSNLLKPLDDPILPERFCPYEHTPGNTIFHEAVEKDCLLELFYVLLLVQGEGFTEDAFYNLPPTKYMSVTNDLGQPPLFLYLKRCDYVYFDFVEILKMGVDLCSEDTNGMTAAMYYIKNFKIPDRKILDLILPSRPKREENQMKAILDDLNKIKSIQSRNSEDIQSLQNILKSVKL